jgi:hypothetical protein
LASGKKYEGELKHEEYHGCGMYVYADGRKYDGLCLNKGARNGLKHHGLAWS